MNSFLFYPLTGSGFDLALAARVQHSARHLETPQEALLVWPNHADLPPGAPRSFGCTQQNQTGVQTLLHPCLHPTLLEDSWLLISGPLEPLQMEAPRWLPSCLHQLFPSPPSEHLSCVPKEPKVSSTAI